MKEQKKQQNKTHKPIKNPSIKEVLKSLLTFHSLLLLLILSIGTYVRTFGIQDKAFAFTYDVGRDLLAVADIVYRHDIPLIGPTTGLPGLFYGPWWYYYLVPAFIIGGGNPQYVVGFIAFCGFLTGVIGYYLGKRLINKTFGLLFASFILFSPATVSLSTQLWNPNIAPLLLMLLFVMLYFLLKDDSKDYDKKKLLLAGVAGFLLGLSIDAEVVYGSLLTVGCLVFLILFSRKRSIVYLPLVGMGFLVALLPRIFFEFRHSFIMTQTILSENRGENSAFSSPTVDHVNIVLSSLKVLWDESVALDHGQLGWLLIVMTIIVLALRYKNLNSSTRQLMWFSVISSIVYGVGLFFFKGAIWGHYIVAVPVFYLYLISLALWQLLTMPKVKYFVLACVLILFFFLLHPFNLLERFTKPAWIGDGSVYKNQLEVVDYVFKKAKGSHFTVAVYTPAVNAYPYQYLFTWYGNKKYGYIPSSSSQKLFFVVLEQESQGFEWRQERWLEERKNEGKTVETKQFPSGVIVQTRVK